MSKQLVQGDVMLIEVLGSSEMEMSVIPPKNGKLVIARGEKTGHTHTIDSDKATLYQDLFGGMRVEVKEDTEITHDEHDVMPVPKGTYKVVRQRQYVPRRDPRNVVD